MVALKSGDSARAVSLCEGIPFIPLRSTLMGNTPGCVFVDDQEMPQVAMIWTKWGDTYLGRS